MLICRMGPCDTHLPLWRECSLRRLSPQATPRIVQHGAMKSVHLLLLQVGAYEAAIHDAAAGRSNEARRRLEALLREPLLQQSVTDDGAAGERSNQAPDTQGCCATPLHTP